MEVLDHLVGNIRIFVILLPRLDDIPLRSISPSINIPSQVLQFWVTFLFRYFGLK